MKEARAMTRRERIALALLVLLAFALRAIAVVQYEREHPQAERPVIDEASYERWALEIAGGDWLGDEVFFQEPLYPYWLGAVYAVFGRDRTTPRMLQAALGALTVALVALLARRTFGALAGWAAGVGMALYEPALLLPCLLLKPNLFLPLLALLLLVATGREGSTRSGRRWLGTGALAGAGALLRGNMLILLPLVVAWPAARALLARQGLRRAAVGCAMCAVGIALVLVPVGARNYAVGGVFALTTSGAGTNLYGGNNAENPYGRATEFSWVRGIPEHEADDWRREAERRLGRSLDPGEVSSYWVRETARSVRDDPGLHARILWNKLRLSLGAYEVPDNHSLDWDARYVALLRWPFPGFGVWGVLGLAGMVLALLPRRSSGAIELAIGFAAYLGTIVLTVTSMRARLPLLCFLVPFGGLAFARLVRADARSRIVVLALVGLAAAIVHLPVLSEDELEADLAKRDFNHAVHLLQRGEDLDEAERIARSLDERYPSSSRVLVLLADLEFRRAMGEPDAERARALIRSALARLQTVATHPDTSPREHFRARSLAGFVQLELRDGAKAERHLRAALEFDPDSADLHRGLGLALLLQDDAEAEPATRTPRLREAAEHFRTAHTAAPKDREVRAGLANALYFLSELEVEPARANALREAEALLLALIAESSTPELERALASVRERRGL